MQWSGHSPFFFVLELLTQRRTLQQHARVRSAAPPKQDIRLWPERDLENTISVFKIMEAFNISQLNLSCCFHSASAFFSFKHRPASSPSTLKFTKTTIN